MHHLNKQTVELSLFEQSPGVHGQISAERFIIFFIIVLGFVGLFYSLPTKAGSISAITTNTNFSNSSEDFAFAFVPEENGSELQVLNTPIAGKETTFFIPDAPRGYKMTTIDFGDGKREHIDNRNKISHIYSMSGKFKVVVEATDKHGNIRDMKLSVDVNPRGK